MDINTSDEIVVTFPPIEKDIMDALIKSEDYSHLSLEESMKNIIESARKEIRICSPFMEYSGFTRLHKEICMKLISGVKISILTRNLAKDDQESARRRIELEKIYKSLMKCNKDGFEIKDYHYALDNSLLVSGIHAKILSADNKLLYFGSGEIRRNSFDKNFEVGIVTSNDEKIGMINAIFDKIFEISRPFTP